jgi:hypothetical protein
MSGKKKLWERPLHVRGAFYCYFIVICTIFRVLTAKTLGDDVGLADLLITTAVITIFFAVVIEIAHRRNGRGEHG